jgi:hypothetical protein
MHVVTRYNPALRLAAYVHSLRRAGLYIETELERHDGRYSGKHARYRLLTPITSIKAVGQGGAK